MQGKLTLENETDCNIQLIAEGHLDLPRKLDDALRVEYEKEMLLIRVTDHLIIRIVMDLKQINMPLRDIERGSCSHRRRPHVRRRRYHEF